MEGAKKDFNISYLESEPESKPKADPEDEMQLVVGETETEIGAGTGDRPGF